MSEQTGRSGNTYFIADLHLTDERVEISARFLDFLDRAVSGADALYVLGDLFDYWVGDDDRSSRIAEDTANKLIKLTRAGTPVYFIHGNRDFLLAQHYARRAGMTLLPDPTTIDLYGTPTLLMHGDTLCTDDRAYQNYRSKIRHPLVRFMLKILPLGLRRQIAKKARAESESAKQFKHEAIMNVNDAEVERVLRTHGYPRLIHGHTHRPAHHLHEVDQHTCERWVLPDWYETGGYLTCNIQGCQLVQF